MVKKIFSFLHKETSGLHQAAYLLALFAILSQILALVRDRLFAHTFGAGVDLDIYYAAFRIPDVIFVSVASLVSLSVLVPFLAEKLESDRNAARRLTSNTFTVFFFAIIGVSGLAFLFMPQLARALFPGFSKEALTEGLIPLARVMLLQPFFLGASNLFASITQVHKKFFLYAMSPLLYNAGIIVGVIFFYPFMGIIGLGFGVVLGALLHMAIQMPFIISSGFFPKFTTLIDWGELWRVVSHSLPRTVALGAHQISLLALLAFASLLSEGSIAIFNLSFNLQSVPLSIIGVSYSVAAFPTLSRLISRGEHNEFFEQMVSAFRHIIFWSLPALTLFVVLRAQIVRVILGSGEFGWDDTRLTSATLAMFALSVVAQALVLLFVRGYYAAGNTRKPVIINLISSVLIVFFAYALTKVFVAVDTFRYFIEILFDIEGVAGTTVVMLALGFTLGMLVNVVIFWVVFQRDFASFSKRVLPGALQSVTASVVMGFVAYFLLNVLDDVFNLQKFIGIFLQGLLAGVGGITAGVGVLIMLKSRELAEIWVSLHKKFWKARVIVGPDPEP